MTFKNEAFICNHNETSTTLPFLPSQFPLMQRRNGPFVAESLFYLADESAGVQEGNHYYRGAQSIPRSLRFARQDFPHMVMPSPPSVRGGRGVHYPSSLCSHTTSTISEIIDIVLRIINEEELEDNHECGSSRRVSPYTPINGGTGRTRTRSLDHEEHENGLRAAGAHHDEDKGRSLQEGPQHQ